jgi:Mrp family chromosome partitioning ATPase
MSHSDGALLVIRSNQVGYSDMERVLDTVPREKIIGAVLNESEEALTGKGYYDYSYYYGASDE